MDCCGITEKKNNSEVSNKKENEPVYLICDTFMLVINLNFIQEVCINLNFPIEYLIIEINNPRETSFKYIRDIMYLKRLIIILTRKLKQKIFQNIGIIFNYLINSNNDQLPRIMINTFY